MSKLERPLTKKYLRIVGGIIVFEFPMVQSSAALDCGKRCLDALILPNKETKEAKASDVYLEGEDIIIVQAKCSRLGMSLMGQALFSVESMRKFFNPGLIRSIALCRKDDSVPRHLLSAYPEVGVVIKE